MTPLFQQPVCGFACISQPGKTVYIPKSHPSGMGGQDVYFPLNHAEAYPQCPQLCGKAPAADQSTSA